MTRPVADCPSCGAPVEFRWAGAVQTTCAYCHSVLVRHDLDLQAVGVKSQVPPTVSPIRIGTRGVFDGRRFEVVGRIVYEHERGRWNEWHLGFEDGGSGWLSDAQAEYAVTFLVQPENPLPAITTLRPGERRTLAGAEYQVAALTAAKYVGTEGELPFESWDRETVPYADLGGENGAFATIDYGEDPPLLFTGQYVAFDDLKLTELRDPEAVTSQAQTLACPNCGGSVTVRAGERTVNVVCGYCSSVLDARVPGLQVLQTFRSRLRHEPKIPLGSRGTLHGEAWDVIGFQVRSIRVEGVDYAWDEYLLYSPRRGFRYLTEYGGHWNDCVSVRTLPRLGREGGRPVADFRGARYKHFQAARAETTFVLGEFPWEVRVGDVAGVDDFVHPPFMLSQEETAGERTWTLSEYVAGERIWKAFGMEGSPPAAKGVYANQPKPGHYESRPLLLAGLAFVLVLLLFGLYRLGAGDRQVAVQSYSFDPTLPEEEQGVVLGPFSVEGRERSLAVTLSANVRNQWGYFEMALYDSAAGRATEFAKEISFYEGVESGERWTEGSRSGTVRIPSVPPGRYYLRIDPQGEFPFSYQVRVRRDVPAMSLFVIAFLLLVIPPVLALLRESGFEAQRWAESDYAPSSDDE